MRDMLREHVTEVNDYLLCDWRLIAGQTARKMSMLATVHPP